jgi:RNA polymerase sigma-70 factor (ECF subfamily)
MPIAPTGGGMLMQARQQDSDDAAALRVRIHRPGDEDHLLIEQVKAGDHDAFDALFQRYFSTVYRQAIRLAGNREEAEEVVQEVFLTIYEKAHTFRGAAAFSTWLYRITANAALSKLRRRKKGEELPLDEYLPSFREDGHHLVRPVVDWSNELEERVASEERQRLIQQALDQLAPVDKAVVVLSDLEGLSDREIGSALGLSVPAVKARLHRSRLFLRGKLAASLGYSPS